MSTQYDTSINFQTFRIILIGVISIFTLNALARIFIYQNIRGMVGTQTAIDTIVYRPVLHTSLSLLIPIAGGIIVGYLAKKNGVYFGGALAILLKIISIGILSTIFFYPVAFYGIELAQSEANKLAMQNIVRQLYSFPVSLLFMAWGGWVGEKLSKYSFQSPAPGRLHPLKER